MDPSTHDHDPLQDEDDYRESEDEDFDPQAAAAAANEDASSADDDSDSEKPARVQTKGKPADGRGTSRAAKKKDDAEDLGFENSGDEAVVKKGTKRRRKHGDAHGEDSGGEGGFVKTRSMRATIEEERTKKPLATTVGATVDVNALWAEMNDPNAALAESQPAAAAVAVAANAAPIDATEKRSDEDMAVAPKGTEKEDLIEIEETIKFAGEVQVRKRLVPRSSVEGQKWLKAQATAQEEAKEQSEHKDSAALARAKRHPDTGEPLLRPLRRVSLWDPNPVGIVKGMPANILADSNAGNRLRVVDKKGLGWHTESGVAKAPKATKLNVVEKSKMDWQLHVAEVGDKEELEKAAKAKGAYLERRDFLERVEARKEDEERRLRFK